MTLVPRSLLLGSAVAVAALALAPAPVHADDGKSSVTSAVQVRDTANDRSVLVLTGRKMNRFKTFGVRLAPTGPEQEVELLEKSRTSLTLGLPGGLPAGAHILSLRNKKGEACDVAFDHVLRASFEDVDLTVGTSQPGVNALSLNSGFRAESTFGNFNVTPYFDPGVSGKTLLGYWEALQDNVPVMRLQKVPTFAFVDIGMDSSDGFAVTGNFEQTLISASQGGDVVVPNTLRVATAGAPATEKAVRIHSRKEALIINTPSVGFAPLLVEMGPDDLSIADFFDGTGELFRVGFGERIELFRGEAFKPGGGSWAAVSDARLKKDVEPLTGALDRLLGLRSVTFAFKEPEKVHQPAGRQTGFLAQEVETVFPEWVGAGEDGIKFVAPKGFESLTVQALRELRTEKDTQIAALEARNAALEKRIDELETRQAARLRALEAALAEVLESGSAMGRENR